LNTAPHRRVTTDRHLYVCHRLTHDQVIELALVSGISVMDLATTPTDTDLRRAIRFLVLEGIERRRKARLMREHRRNRNKKPR